MTDLASRLNVLTIGRQSRFEFQTAVNVLGNNSQLEFCASDASGIASFTERGLSCDAAELDLIVLLQSFAGEFSAMEPAIERLRLRFPLAPVVCILGSFSEGETRSGQPLVRTTRLFWYEAAPRLQLGFEAAQRDECSWWSWPWTLSDAERGRKFQQLKCTLEPGRVGVFAASPDVAEPTMELLQHSGAEPVFVPPDCQSCPGLTAGVWDSAAGTRSRPLPLASAVAMVPGRVVALVTFPRTQDIEAAIRSGATVVMPKLHTAADLLWHVRRFQMSGGMKEDGRSRAA